jgi:hypothetical protein
MMRAKNVETAAAKVVEPSDLSGSEFSGDLDAILTEMDQSPDG